MAEGDTVEEAVFNGVDVVKMIAVYRAERGELPRLTGIRREDEYGSIDRDSF